ncbi:GNAT family acetyltransferase [Pacificispira spongiicola]|nr:GNAT family acetyltransferase [Pacificispira spongiicola]
MNIRECTDADIPHLVTLWQECGLTRPWNDPEADIALARRYAGSTVLVGEVDGAVIASAMAGFDGHRGWIYYVAISPDHQGKGLSRPITAAAENWLRDLGCPKVELIIREGNEKVLAVYDALDYQREPRMLMAKWLVEPPAPSADMGDRLLDVTITYLEMTARPDRPMPHPPATEQPLSLQRLHEPTVSYYRYLQHTVGDPWLWWERRLKSDGELAAIIHDDAVEIYVLSLGGVPTGFVELDFRAMPTEAEVAYFGLLPEFIGRGFGPYLLQWAIDCAWNRSPAPEKLSVNTCTLDHPKALAGYQKAGFEVVGQETKQVPDPVRAGHIPKSVKILTPGY